MPDNFEEKEGVIGSQPKGKLDAAYLVFLSKKRIIQANSLTGKQDGINSLEKELREQREHDDLVEKTVTPLEIDYLQDRLQQAQRKGNPRKEIKNIIQELEQTKKRTRYQHEIYTAKQKKKQKDRKAKTKHGWNQKKLRRNNIWYLNQKWDALEGLIVRSGLKPDKDATLEA